MTFALGRDGSGSCVENGLTRVPESREARETTLLKDVFF